MPIEKDLAPIYKGMIRATYTPVMRRTIVLLLINCMDKMQAALKVNDEHFVGVIHSQSGKKSLIECLHALLKRAPEIINEILLQYGIHTGGEMVDFYHEHFLTEFSKQIDYVAGLVHRGDYQRIDKIARTQV